MTTNKAATRSVVRNLTKTTGMHREAWQSLRSGSVEEFRTDAISYLGDASNLRTVTLESADWREVYAHFHTLTEVQPSGALVGYGRVSTKDQDTKLQQDALKEAGCVKIFEEKASGKSTAGRDALASLLEYARVGDTVCVWRLDRLGRSTLDILRIAEELHARGISLRILMGKLAGTYSPRGEGKFFFTIMAAFAELERDIIIERTRAGLDAAKAQGRVGGRPTVVDGDKMAVAKARQANGESVPSIAKALGISRATLYRHLGSA